MLQSEFRQALKAVSAVSSKGIEEISIEVAAKYGLEVDFDGEGISRIVEGMIFVDFDYAYEDMPLGGWRTNCFDGRLCELDYSEKLIDFFSSFSHPLHRGSLPLGMPTWIYSSNRGVQDYQRLLYWGGHSPSDCLESLRCWGKLLDGFLETRNDYLLLDYLVNAFYFDKSMDVCGILKRYSLCQLFLEKDRESELDWKIVPFLTWEEDAESLAKAFRRLRNKLAHGDFVAFDSELEKYAQQFMDGRFAFDYSELSRRNWAIGNVCHTLDRVLYSIVELLFLDRAKLESIKMRNKPE